MDGIHGNYFTIPHYKAAVLPDIFSENQKPKNMESTYKWTDYFTKQRHSCRCELLSRTNTMATIRLKGYGPQGRPPGSVMRVKLASVGIGKEQPLRLDLDWHAYTD